VSSERAVGRLRRAWRAVAAYHEAVLIARWQGGLRRAAREEEDRFLAVLLLASYGVDDPAAFETIEVTPTLIEAFHRWHLREGVERFPEGGVCC
jgi:hypothetical protein